MQTAEGALACSGNEFCRRFGGPQGNFNSPAMAVSLVVHCPVIAIYSDLGSLEREEIAEGREHVDF